MLSGNTVLNLTKFYGDMSRAGCSDDLINKVLEILGKEHMNIGKYRSKESIISILKSNGCPEEVIVAIRGYLEVALNGGIMEVYAKPGELLPEIEKCRSKFRNMLYSVSHDLTDSTRERIRSATEDITKSMITFKVNEKDKHDNTIFVEFKLNGLHRFLNIDLFKHSDYTKRSEISDNGVILQPAVPMCGNYGMDEKRENHRLERYMQKMRLEYDVGVWDYNEDMIPLLKELGRMADLNNFHEETVMLFYLIGAFGYFWGGKCPWLFDAAISPIMSLEDFRRYGSKRKSAGVLLYGHDKKQV